MFGKTIVILILILATIYSVKFLFFAGSDDSPKNDPPKTETTKTKEKPILTIKTPAKDKEELLKKLKNLFFETNPDIDFAVAVYDLKNDARFGYNEENPQHAASVTKVLTAVYLLKQVQDRKIKLSDELGAFNVEFNLKQMVNQSNTEAWEIIDDFLELNPQDDFAHSIGLASVDFQQNLMSPKDAVTLFAKLYKGELLDEPYQKKLFSYMQNTETENLISPAIPKETPIYHKTGVLEGEVHDVAIINHSIHPFVLAIFTDNKVDPKYDERADLIQKTAAEVYAFFTDTR